MGRIQRPKKVKLFAGLLVADIGLIPKVKNALEKAFGKIDFESASLDFRHTDYYEKEMGAELKRKFFGFERLLDPADAYKAKIKTNRLEGLFLKEGKRSVNIDPGYVDMSKVLLFSTKDYTHRIYLRSGIFAEATLFYKDKTFAPWPWTYPDYKTEDYIEIFKMMRNLYKNKIAGN